MKHVSLRPLGRTSELGVRVFVGRKELGSSPYLDSDHDDSFDVFTAVHLLKDLRDQGVIKLKVDPIVERHYAYCFA